MIVILIKDDDDDSLVDVGDDLLAKTNTNEQSGPQMKNPLDPMAADFQGSLAKALETSDDLSINVNDKLTETINKRRGKR